MWWDDCIIVLNYNYITLQRKRVNDRDFKFQYFSLFWSPHAPYVQAGFVTSLSRVRSFITRFSSISTVLHRHFRCVLINVFSIPFLGGLGSPKNHSYYQDKQLHHEELPESRHSPWSAKENPSLNVGRFKAPNNIWRTRKRRTFLDIGLGWIWICGINESSLTKHSSSVSKALLKS